MSLQVPLNFKKMVGFVQFLTGKTQGGVAKSIHYNPSHFSVLMNAEEDKPELTALLYTTYKKEIQDFFGEVNHAMVSEPEVVYGNKKAKVIDADRLTVTHSPVYEAMLKVVLLNQAKLISIAKGEKLDKVLNEMKAMVKELTGKDFDKI